MPASDRSKFEKFDFRLVHRSALKNAPYNPRQISDDAKKKLRDNIKRVGLIDPVIWNETTGNLVGGHQRLAALDALEGNPSYSLTVAVVRMDEKTEKEQNIFLNNPNAQGDWDLEKLEKLVQDVSVEFTGFDPADIYQLFGDAAGAANSEAFEMLAEQRHAAMKTYNDIAEKNNEKDDANFYCVVVFPNRKGREDFAALVGQEDNKWLNGEKIAAALRAAKGEAHSESAELPSTQE